MINRWDCQLEVSEEAGRWRPIETAPKDGTAIILGYEGSHSEEGFWMADTKRNHWGKAGWFATDSDILCDYPHTPTHWQPLPPAPGAMENDK